MDRNSLWDEAEDCRRQACSYLGRPEAPFLLRVAREFERLAEGPDTPDNDDGTFGT